MIDKTILFLTKGGRDQSSRPQFHHRGYPPPLTRSLKMTSLARLAISFSILLIGSSNTFVTADDQSQSLLPPTTSSSTDHDTVDSLPAILSTTNALRTTKESFSQNFSSFVTQGGEISGDKNGGIDHDTTTEEIDDMILDKTKNRNPADDSSRRQGQGKALIPSNLNILAAVPRSGGGSHGFHLRVRKMQHAFSPFSDDHEELMDDELMGEELMYGHGEEEYLPRAAAILQSVEYDIELDEQILAIQSGNFSVIPKKKDPADVHVMSAEEFVEKIHEVGHRALSEIDNTISHSVDSNSKNRRALYVLNHSDMQTLEFALTTNGGLEVSLDILASTLITGLCYVACWAAAGPTGGVSVAAAPLFCAAASFWSGIIFSTFEWINGIFGTPSNDDAWWAVEAGKSDHSDGNSLAISYHRNGEVDKDSLGSIGRGQIKESREDLDSKNLIAIEIRVENTDDVCVKNMLFRVGKQPSGTGRIEEVPIPGSIVALITKTRLHDTKEMCLFFGDAEGAIGNFKFHWPSALTCHKNFGVYFTLDYANCLTWAMYSYHVRENGRYQRYTYSSNPSLPSYMRSPMKQIKSRGVSSLCVHIGGSDMTNYTPVFLNNCHPYNNQKFDFDVDGRLRSKVDPTKCIEAGSRGTLYRKLYVYECHNGKWQEWQRYADGKIKNKHHGMYIGLAYCRRQRSAALELRRYEHGACGEAQKFSW